jgi:hypothetical protein
LEGKISWGCGNTWANGTGHTSQSWMKDDFLSLVPFKLMLIIINNDFKDISKGWHPWVAHIGTNRSNQLKVLLTLQQFQWRSKTELQLSLNKHIMV